MAKYDSRIIAVLITAIIHLIAGITFMLIKIGSLDIKEYTKQYEVALQQVPEVVHPRPDELSKTFSVEQVVKGDQDLANIARNLASQPDVKINKEDFIDKVKEELIESGKLGKDNYIDEQKKQKQSGVEIDEQTEIKKTGNQDKKKEKANELASKYAGPTRIYYNLPGRIHTFLPLPIYKCEGAGKVVLAIEVSPRGEVLKATVIESESTVSDPCLLDNAVGTALVSRFNPDINATRNETGTLTYQFVAQ